MQQNYLHLHEQAELNELSERHIVGVSTQCRYRRGASVWQWQTDR